MRTLTSLIVIVSLFSSPSVLLAQSPVSADEEATAFRHAAAAIPPGSRIKVRIRDGRRLTATLMAADEQRILIKRDARVPEPAISVAYAELTRLERDQKSGFSWGKALGIGLASGVGAILTLFAIAVAMDD